MGSSPRQTHFKRRASDMTGLPGHIAALVYPKFFRPKQGHGAARHAQGCAARARTSVHSPARYLERVTRIELAFSAWEADVLPLNYTRAGTARFLARNPFPKGD